MNTISISKIVKLLCVYKDTNISQLADRLGLHRQNMHEKIKQDNFKFNDIVTMFDVLGYDLQMKLIDRETGRAVEFVE